jgi:hypothetical protein
MPLLQLKNVGNCGSWYVYTKGRGQFCKTVETEVLTTLTVKTDVFWNVTPYSLVQVYRLFRRSCWLHHQGRFIVDTSVASQKLVQLVSPAPQLSKQKPYEYTQLLKLVPASSGTRTTYCVREKRRYFPYMIFIVLFTYLKTHLAELIINPYEFLTTKESFLTLIMMNITLHRNSYHCCC